MGSGRDETHRRDFLIGGASIAAVTTLGTSAAAKEVGDIKQVSPPDIRDQVLPLAQELVEKLNKIDPNLVVTLSSYKNAPTLRREQQGATPFDFGTTFNDFSNGANFVNAFAKAGDGFINIHHLE
jgi:hypothetical protein